MNLSTALQSHPEYQERLNELIEYYSLSLEDMHLDGRVVTPADHSAIADIAVEALFAIDEIYQEAIQEAEGEPDRLLETGEMPQEIADRLCGGKWITCGKPWCNCTGACEASISDETMDFEG